MMASAPRYTYADPYLSLWQSASEEVKRRHASFARRAAPSTLKSMAVKPLPDLMQAVHIVGNPVLRKQKIVPEVMFASRGVGGVVEDCAKLAAEFLWAEITGDHGKAQQLAAELKDSVCDPGWAECLTTYLAFKAEGGHFPYRANMNVVVDLGTKTKLAIIGDWGTGQDVAINLLQQVKALSPDVLVHLGDVYYSGTYHEEQENFLNICRQVLRSDLPLFSLCGNHDMYSGGNGYYWLLDQIGQKASYFCLQNSAWQFLAMDTGHNDHDPITITSNMTSLNGAEVQWHLNKIQQAGQRKTVLLSHHQLFSPFGAVGSIQGMPYAYNPNLLANFQSVLPKISLWFWGHEHTLALYAPYMGLQRGRCVGCSAVPVFTAQQQYANASGLQTYQGTALPVWNAQQIVGNNGTDYFHAFAMMTLEGASAEVDYYQVPILGTAAKVCSESVS